MEENYLKRTDESLGKLVRETAEKMADKRGFASAMSATGARLLVTSLIDLNSPHTTITLEGFTDQDGTDCGDWKIDIHKIK